MKAARKRHCRHRRRIRRGIGLPGSPADYGSGERRKLPPEGSRPKMNLVHFEPYITVQQKHNAVLNSN